MMYELCTQCSAGAFVIYKRDDGYDVQCLNCAKVFNLGK